MEMHNPVHPGRLIRVAMGKGLTVSALAKHLGVTRAHMSMIVNGRAGLSATMALKLDETFENSDGFWWQAQSGYELAKARRLKRKKLSPPIETAGQSRISESQESSLTSLPLAHPHRRHLS
jgi:addiction module HigA family antidote